MDIKSNPYGPYIQENGPEFLPPEEVAIFVPKFNSIRKDATGAFHLEAGFFCDHWGIKRERVCFINNKLPKSCHRENNVAEEFLSKMAEKQNASSKPIAVWAFFMHGYTHGTQFSVRSPGHPHFDTEYEKVYRQFINIISEHSSPLVILYACSTGDDPDGDPDTAPGSGDNSFADYLRDDLCKKGAVYCRVFSHTTAGPTTTNPFIKILDGEGLAEGGIGGKLLASPGTKEFKKLQKLLSTDFRFLVPFMTLDSIKRTLLER